MTPRPGITDSLVDVPGLRVGSVEMADATGVTAVIAPHGALASVDVRGAAPGTRETDTLAPSASGESVHAVLLVGRSVFGLAAADGATLQLESRGIGLRIAPETGGPVTIPIVAAAVIFDLAVGDPLIRPGAPEGHRVVSAALDGGNGRPASGRVGAGTGASVGGVAGERRPGGLGHASLVAEVAGGELIVGALAVVNSAGTPYAANGRSMLADVGGFGDPGPLPKFGRIVASRTNTTLVVVGTNGRLGKAQLGHVASMAHDGLARAIRPIHTGVDGDVVFALSSADRGEVAGVVVHDWMPAAVSIVGAMAADAVSRAVADALRPGAAR
jgi:L-aminopeptidase/D-esterase-like protein